LETAVLVVLEKLTPAERAAFVLREAFDYPYAMVADIVETTEVAARKLVSRARRAVAADRRQPVDAAGQRRLLAAFLAAARAGDLAELEALFAADVASYTDGGGAVRNASRIPVFGRDRVARYVAAFAPRFWVDVTVDWVQANGRSSVLVSRDGVPFAWLTVSAGGEGIDRIHWVLNPAKLTRIASAARTG
jgi:RNA polymerase sigma-70 factor (ECF subfamily)